MLCCSAVVFVCSKGSPLFIIDFPGYQSHASIYRIDRTELISAFAFVHPRGLSLSLSRSFTLLVSPSLSLFLEFRYMYLFRSLNFLEIQKERVKVSIGDGPIQRNHLIPSSNPPLNLLTVMICVLFLTHKSLADMLMVDQFCVKLNSLISIDFSYDFCIFKGLVFMNNEMKKSSLFLVIAKFHD